MAARDVLALQFLLGAIERRAVEDARLGDADVLQRLLQRVVVEFLVADECRSELIVGRSCTMTTSTSPCGLEAHVAEEAGRVQRLDRGGGLLVVDALADLDRQVAEDGAGLGALHAFDADVLDDERLERQRARARTAPRTMPEAPSVSSRRDVRAPADGKRGVQNKSGNVIEKRQRHQHGQHRHADALADLERAVGDGTALDNLGEIIQQMSPIQQRNRQQVEHAEADADEREIADEHEHARLRRLSRVSRPSSAGR